MFEATYILAAITINSSDAVILPADEWPINRLTRGTRSSVRRTEFLSSHHKDQASTCQCHDFLSALASLKAFSLPLVAALPSWEMHDGDKTSNFAYLLYQEGRQALMKFFQVQLGGLYATAKTRLESQATKLVHIATTHLGSLLVKTWQSKSPLAESKDCTYLCSLVDLTLPSYCTWDITTSWEGDCQEDKHGARMV